MTDDTQKAMDPNTASDPALSSQKGSVGSDELPDLGELQSEINKVADEIGNDTIVAKSEGEGTIPQPSVGNDPVEESQTPSQKRVNADSVTPVGSSVGTSKSNSQPTSSIAGSPPIRMAPGVGAGVIPKSEIQGEGATTVPQNDGTLGSQVVSSVSDKSKQQAVGPLGLMGAKTSAPANPMPLSASGDLAGATAKPETAGSVPGGGALPPSPTVQESNSKEGGSSKPKSAVGKKILGIVLGLLLIGGIAGGAYYYYTTQVQQAQIAEVSGGVCSSSPPTASVCYGKSYGYVVDDNWQGSCAGFTKDPSKTYSLVCQNTTNNYCAANCVENGSGGGGGGGGSSCSPPQQCDNGGTWEGDCVFIECPYGDTNGDGKCTEGADYGSISHPKGSCDSLKQDMFGNNKCGQVDAIKDGPGKTYCNLTSNNSCNIDEINWNCDPDDPPPSDPPADNDDPTCSGFSISDTSIDIGDTVTINANGSDPDGSVAWIRFFWAKTGVDYCAANGANWTMIEHVNAGNASVVWDTSSLAGKVSPGESIQISTNVADNEGGWCTSNPGGTCGTNASLCPSCKGVITINELPSADTPILSEYCDGPDQKISVSWTSTGLQSYGIDISDKELEPFTGYNFWNKLVEGGVTSTVAPDGFKQWNDQSIDMPDIGIGKTYSVRIQYTDTNTHSDIATITTTDLDCSPEAEVACYELSVDDGAPLVGDTITLTCSGTSTSNTILYDFRYSIGGGAFSPISTNSNTATLDIEEAGEYVVQCRACIETDNATLCDPVWSGATR